MAIKKSAGVTAAARKLYIVGDIDWEAYRAFSEELTALETASTQGILIELASDGGDAQVALAYYARIKTSNCAIEIRAIGNVASAAVLILAAGAVRTMYRDSWVMVHEEQIQLSDKSVSEVEKEAKQLRRFETQWNELLEANTDIHKDEWCALHKETTWLTAKECLHFGLIDSII